MDKRINHGLLLACLLASFSSAFNARSYDPLIGGIAASASVELLTASGLSTRFMWGYALGQIIAIFSPARYRRHSLAVCSALAAVLVLATALVPISQMLTLRWLSGFFVGPLIPLAMALIGDHTAVSLRTRVMTQFMAGQALGITLSVPLAVLLMHWGDVRWAQMSGAVPLLLCAALMLGGMPAAAQRGTDRGPSVHKDRPALKRMVPLYGIVMIEGAAVFGLLATAPLLMPQVPAYLPGLIFGSVGLLFISLVSYVGRGVKHGAGLGAVMLLLAVFLALAGGPLSVGAFFLLALGYYNLHPSLQSRATQLSNYYRGATTALLAVCFFIGQGIGTWLLVKLLTAGWAW